MPKKPHPIESIAEPNDAPPDDKLCLTALGIGHGDAILLQFGGEDGAWTCLVDGGPSAGRLNERLEAADVKHIDLLILTHLDSDHIQGLQGITNHRSIGSFWGPPLAAFERHLWLFGARGQSAIERGRQLETSLTQADVYICYPLEGYESHPVERAVGLTVLSPAARLIKRLLVGDDVNLLFSQEPMPLGWLLDSEAPVDPEQSDAAFALDQALARRVLVPADLSGVRPRTGSADERRAVVTAEATPEYFGNSVLNNTSLVVYLTVRTDSRSHTILLTGDQENWTYLLGRNPRGSRTDVLKASHHGASVFVDGRESAHNEIFSATRPKVVLVSGNGVHKLPHVSFREGAVRWGASVVCTCVRKTELFDRVPT